MAGKLKPIRRVVTGHDGGGRSCVIYDSSAPNVNPKPNRTGSGMTDIWVFDSCPIDISGTRDDGNRPFNFEPPSNGGHLRIVQEQARQPGYDPDKDPFAVAPHPTKKGPGGTEYRGGSHAYRSPTHRSKTVDYGVLLEGERILNLEEADILMRQGDVIVQLGNWHAWSSSDSNVLMAFVMMGATLEES